MSQKIEISIDGSTVAVDSSATVLEAALEHDVFIPHLCHDPDLEPAGVCRLCLVEVDGRRPKAGPSSRTLVGFGLPHAP